MLKKLTIKSALEKAGESDEISDAVNLSDFSGSFDQCISCSGMYIKVKLS